MHVEKSRFAAVFAAKTKSRANVTLWYRVCLQQLFSCADWDCSSSKSEIWRRFQFSYYCCCWQRCNSLEIKRKQIHTHTKDLKREIFLFLIHSACFFLSGFCGVRANMSAVKHFLSLSKDSTGVVSSVVVSDITFASWRNARAERKKSSSNEQNIAGVQKPQLLLFHWSLLLFYPPLRRGIESDVRASWMIKIWRPAYF